MAPRTTTNQIKAGTTTPRTARARKAKADANGAAVAAMNTAADDAAARTAALVADATATPAKAAPAAKATAKATGLPTARGAKPSATKVHAGPPAWQNAKGEVLPMTAASYPEVVDGTLRCLGACGQVLPAARLGFTRNKGDGLGRHVECFACQRARLAENKERKAAGREPLPKPRATTIAPAPAASA